MTEVDEDFIIDRTFKEVNVSELSTIQKMNPYEFNRWLKEYMYNMIDPIASYIEDEMEKDNNYLFYELRNRVQDVLDEYE